MRISCKVPLRAAFYVYYHLVNQVYVFQTAPVVVYRLMTSVFSTSQHRHSTGVTDIVDVYVNISSFEE